MNIGKREQIVIGSIAAILLIVVLHLLIFAPSEDNFKRAKGERDAMAAQISGLSTIQDPKILTAFEDKTNTYLKNLEAGMNRLKMDEPDCFILPKLEEVQAAPGQPPLPPYATPTPPPMGGPIPTPSPDEPHVKRQHEILEVKLPEQLKLILAEITKLRESTRGRGIQLSFLGNNLRYGWNVPTQLPANMQTSLLWDQVKTIAGHRTSMDKMNKTSTQYPSIMNAYVRALNQLGVNLYFSENLARFGDFVPIIQRLCLADLILQKLAASPTPVMILNEPLDAEKLLHYLFIDLPPEPLEGINENKYYFLYEELRNLNYLIELAQTQGIKDITAVTLRGFAYVREMPALDAPTEVIVDPEKLIDDEIDDKNALAAAAMNSGGVDPNAPPGDPNVPGGAPMGDPYANPNVDPNMVDPFAMGPTMPTLNLLSSTPQTGDLGFAIPIRVTFVAPNNNGFTYLYELLRDKPMAEVHRLVMRSTSVYNPAIPVTVQPNPTSSDVEMTATVLFVPKLFNTMDTVRQMIDEVRAKANGTTVTTAQAPAPPPPPGQ